AHDAQHGIGPPVEKRRDVPLDQPQPLRQRRAFIVVRAMPVVPILRLGHDGRLCRMYLVTGSTGNVGSAVVAALAAVGQPVRALVRKPRGDASGQVVGDLDDPASLRPALDGATGVFLLPGYADMPGILAEVVRAGVGKVVLLSGSSAPSGD